MSRERNTTTVLILVIVLALAALYFYPRLEKELQPELVTAWVALEVEGTGIAEVAPHQLEAPAPGEPLPVRLHAVVEATTRSGETVYYTEAPALRLHGEDIPAESLRSWDLAGVVKVLWFSVEGGAPFLRATSTPDLEQFQFRENFRSRWPEAWSIPARLGPASSPNKRFLYGEDQDAFGTQRYHVRVEVYAREKELVPEQRVKSWGADQLPARAAEFPTLTVALPGHLAPASKIFNLTQIEIEGDSEEFASLLRQVNQLHDQHLAFNRLTVVNQLLEATGSTPDDLDWQPLELDAGLPWARNGSTVPAVAPGDLLRVLDRIVILYRDAQPGDIPPSDADAGNPGAVIPDTTPGILDRQDLVFDFARGAAVRPLEHVFTGSGEVSWVHFDG